MEKKGKKRVKTVLFLWYLMILKGPRLNGRQYGTTNLYIFHFFISVRHISFGFVCRVIVTDINFPKIWKKLSIRRDSWLKKKEEKYKMIDNTILNTLRKSTISTMEWTESVQRISYTESVYSKQIDGSVSIQTQFE